MLTKALVGGPVWGKPGSALFIPKLGPVARPLGWNGLVEGGCGRAAGTVKGLVKAPKARPVLPPPPAVADWSVGTGPATPKMLLGIPPADGPGARRPPISARLLG